MTPKRAKPKRSTLTRKERADRIELQGGSCFTFGCAGKPVIAEHWLPCALKNDAKPDCILCADCARRKTYGHPGRVGGDIRDIKHIRKLEEKRTQYDRIREDGPKLKTKGARIKSRGFDKSLSRKFDGTTVRK